MLVVVDVNVLELRKLLHVKMSVKEQNVVDNSCKSETCFHQNVGKTYAQRL